ncbi:protein of unknown function [Methylocella tundrae]|uniref:Uncharacterized protein n=1 Tax=Methylocella tundrae TaxID=227605 RepID=A0A4U8YYF3_METTU|nr:protein of unknown function [Methylocella tundrae]
MIANPEVFAVALGKLRRTVSPHHFLNEFRPASNAAPMKSKMPAFVHARRSASLPHLAQVLI